MMKKAVITGPGQANVVEVPRPEPKEDWALVRIRSAPMCTEYKGFLAGQESEHLGHEAAGEVVDTAQPGPVAPGDRVVVMPLYPCGTCELCVAGNYIYCQNGPDFEGFTGSPEGRATYAEYILKPGWLLLPIPDDLSYDHASLACCALGPSFGAMARMEVGAFDTILITGMGPVGIGGVVNARYRGARVIAVEMEDYRQELATDMGADAVFDPREEGILEAIRKLCGGVGPDCALDCSGTVSAHRLCIDAVRRRGQVAFVGECSEQTPIRVSQDTIRKGLTLHGSWHYNINHYPRIVQIIRNSPLVERMITHRFPLADVQEALEVSSTPEHCKIVLKP